MPSRNPAPAADAAWMKARRSYLRPIYSSEVMARFDLAASYRASVRRTAHPVLGQPFRGLGRQAVPVLGLAGSFEREAIRPHVLGTSPTCCWRWRAIRRCCCTWTTISRSARTRRPRVRGERRQAQRRIGINENLAREILELHTLGVGGGYTQADVTSFAEVITGWSIGDDRGRFAAGTPGNSCSAPSCTSRARRWCSIRAMPDTGVGQGVAVLRDLARQQATARFIATKLARHFIADDPPPAAVEPRRRRLHRQRGRSAGGLSGAAGCARGLGAAAAEVQDAIGLHRLGLPRPDASGRSGQGPARAFRAAGPAHLVTGLARRLAGPQCRLGRGLRPHQAHRVGGRGGRAGGQPPRCRGACAATAGRQPDRGHAHCGGARGECRAGD